MKEEITNERQIVADILDREDWELGENLNEVPLWILELAQKLDNMGYKTE